MKNNCAKLNYKTKVVKFKYNNQKFKINLAEGDLHDSWNAITLKDGSIFDFNFSLQDGCKPSIELYPVDKTLKTNFSDYQIIKITKIVGTEKDYFQPINKKYKVYAEVTTTCYTIVEATSKEEARDKASDIDGGDFITEDNGNFSLTYSEEI